MSTADSVHLPVMAEEVLQWLAPQPGQILVDGTLGGGGHTRLLAEAVGEQGRVIACDRDPLPVERAKRTLADLPVTPVQSSYAELPEILSDLNLPAVDGILLDLGLSSDQLADTERGFGFTSEEPIDLRFDTSQGQPAWRMLGRMPAEQLANLIFQYGEERFSRRIARRIVENRRRGTPITATELAELVTRAVPPPRGRRRIHPATRTFQALRIAVNDELGELERAIHCLSDCLRPGGRLAIISFHSLEDRLVKHGFRNDSRFTALTKKPIRPNEAEVLRNPRSRSAKFRVAEASGASADEPRANAY